MVVLGGISHEDAMVAGGSESGATRGAKLVSGDPIILASSYVEMGYLTYGVIAMRRVSPVTAPVSCLILKVEEGYLSTCESIQVVPARDYQLPILSPIEHLRKKRAILFYFEWDKFGQTGSVQMLQ